MKLNKKEKEEITALESKDIEWHKEFVLTFSELIERMRYYKFYIKWRENKKVPVDEKPNI